MHAAERLGRLLRAPELVPDRIISSSARRARDTAHRVAAEIRFTAAIDERDELYLAGPEAYITAVKQLALHAERVLLVGHNPGLEELVLILTGERRALPCAGLIVCSLPIADFSGLSTAVTGKMALFWSPQEPPS